MRRHYALSFQAKDAPPAGDKDMESWLRFYKLNPGAEQTFIPAPERYADMKEGDILWFVLDNKILAGVPILRTQEDEINKRLELWYDAARLRFYPASLPSILVGHEVNVPVERGESWWSASLEKKSEEEG